MHFEECFLLQFSDVVSLASLLSMGVYFMLLLVCWGQQPNIFWNMGTPKNRSTKVFILYIYIGKFNFGESIWDKSVVLLGTSWGTWWEHIGNRKINSKIQHFPKPKRKRKTWAILSACWAFSLAACKFYFLKFLFTIFILGFREQVWKNGEKLSQNFKKLCWNVTKFLKNLTNFLPKKQRNFLLFEVDFLAKHCHQKLNKEIN